MSAVLEKKKQQQEYKTQLQKLFVQSNGNVIYDNVKLPHQWQAKGYTIKDKNGKKWYISLAFADIAHKKPFAMFIRSNNSEKTQVADIVIQSMQSLCRGKGIAETIIQQQRTKYNNSSNIDKVARAIGMAMRHNIPMSEIVNTLEQHHDGLSTLLFHIRKLLSTFIKDGTQVVVGANKVLCPDCNTPVVFHQGCKMCMTCGWTACG